MRIYGKSLVLAVALFLGICITVAHADEPRGIVGWEKNSVYNKHYNLDEWDYFKAYVVGLKKITPLPGMSPGIALLVRDRDTDEIITVHLGPISFVNPNAVRVNRGEKVKVKGVWAEIGGEEVFMASKIKKGNYYEYKVRLTKDGTPFWTMTPEELAREMRSK